MCGKKQRRSLVSWVLCFLLLLSPFCSYCFAEVTLSDEEATELMSEIKESQKDLTELKNQLSEAETQLNDVKNTYEEQKTYYETQLTEARKNNENLKTAVTITGTSTVIFVILTVVFILL